MNHESVSLFNVNLAFKRRQTSFIYSERGDREKKWRRRNERLWNSQSAYSFFYDFDTIMTLATGHLQIYAYEYILNVIFNKVNITSMKKWLTTLTTSVVCSLKNSLTMFCKHIKCKNVPNVAMKRKPYMMNDIP